MPKEHIVNVALFFSFYAQKRYHKKRAVKHVLEGNKPTLDRKRLSVRKIGDTCCAQQLLFARRFHASRSAMQSFSFIAHIISACFLLGNDFLWEGLSMPKYMLLRNFQRMEVHIIILRQNKRLIMRWEKARSSNSERAERSSERFVNACCLCVCVCEMNN